MVAPGLSQMNLQANIIVIKTIIYCHHIIIISSISIIINFIKYISIITWPSDCNPSHSSARHQIQRCPEKKCFKILVTMYSGVLVGHPSWSPCIWSPQLVTLYAATLVGHLVLEEGEAVLAVPVVGLVLHPVKPGHQKITIMMVFLMTMITDQEISAPL